MEQLLVIFIFLWAFFIILPQEAHFLKKHNLVKKESFRFFYFSFEMKKIVSEIQDEKTKAALKRKIRTKQIGSVFGGFALVLYTYLLLLD